MAESGRRGLFITLEGVEGCGKSTQAAALVEHLESLGRRVVTTREPGGTPLGERIRDILLDPERGGMEPATELMLYLASRAEHVARVILPALDRGETVVSDRFADASVAYQGGGRGLGADLVDSLNRIVTRGVEPDVTFLFDLDASSGLDRLSGRRGPSERLDRIESEALSFHTRVRDAYVAAAARAPGRFVVLDAGRRPGEIAEEVRRKVDALLATSGNPERSNDS